ncbi:MAG: hypothetical protein P4L71_18710 [Acetobacteraceae bacterium]|nr:hypothetical protein [Acetobacteraceae bacterium]
MGPSAALVLLATLAALDGPPPSPDIAFTQVGGDWAELGDSYPAICAGGRCRASFPVSFAGRACLVNAWVLLPAGGREGAMMFSVHSCVPGSAAGSDAQSLPFQLDSHGATTMVVSLADSPVNAGPVNDLVHLPAARALVRVDVVLPAPAEP